MTTVLVTGASGLVGRAVAGALQQEGVAVAGTARGPAPTAGLAWHRADLLRSDAAAGLVAAARPTHLVHAAWDVGPGYRDAPGNEAWVAASLGLLEAFAAHGGRRAVLVGSCLEYDWSGAAERLSEARPLAPRSPYAAAKDVLRIQAEALAGATGVTLVWARLFYLFGAGERPERLVPSIARAALAGRAPEVRRPNDVIDILDARDAGAALARLATADAAGPVNVGRGEGVRIGALAAAVALAAGGLRTPVVTAGGDAGPALRVVADTARLRAATGWRPAIPLDRGLRDAVHWWQARA